MEIIGLLFIIFAVWLVFKILGALFYAGAFLITLPFKILGFVLLFVLFVPLIGIAGILIALAPVILIIMGIVYLIRHV